MNTTLLSEKEDLSSFFCTDADLNEYFHQDALKDHQNLYSVTHLVKSHEKIIGFFTLVTDTIQLDWVDESLFPDFDYRKLPAVKIARLATHRDYERRGIGKYMIIDIFRRVSNVTLDIGCCVITVDAKRDAVGFYEKYAFRKVAIHLKQDTEVMYLNIKQLIEDICDGNA